MAFRRGGHRRTMPTAQSASPPAQSGSPSAGPSHVHSPSSPPSDAGPSNAPSPPQPSQLQSPNPSIQSTTDTRPVVVPHGDSFENSVSIIRQINRIVNNHWGGTSLTYTSTPGPTKDLWWSEFKRAFTWDPAHELEIKRIFLKKCGDHIRHTLNHAKTRNKKPPCITDENWTRILGVWETEESKQKSHQNKTNQSYNSGDSSATYAGGSINIEEHTRRLTQEMGKEPLFIETFTRTFQKKDKTWSGDRARAMKEKYEEAELAQRNSSASEGSEPSVGNDLNIWLEVTGGSKGGRILGLGSLSRTHRVPATSSSSSTQPAMRAQIDNLTEEVSHLKGIINQRDEEMREMRRQQTEEMREMRRQQELIMKHFQLGSAPSQLPDVPDDAGEDDDS
ncbi:uncharacterized protein LOC141846957 [Curcuma longa]|uniref:uncharacterized protein LOC141846957 n=1 Tax=Curcuma longa TaxID=136217 RepID=UPI003D9F667C